jgi:hypothetical protein
MGIICQRGGALEQAEGWLRKAARTSPADRQVDIALGDVLHALGRWKEAVALHRRAFRTDGLVVRYVEMDIAYACNLHCTACTHYSNYTLKGVLDLDTGRQWMAAWAGRLLPRRFRLLGGEPMLNPALTGFVRYAAEVWPDSRREVVSNGFFLDRHPDLPQALAETATTLSITLHDDSPDYVAKVQPDRYRMLAETYGFPLRITSGTAAEFHRLYRGEGDGMLPFADGAPAASWAACQDKDCPTIHLGRLWKCPPIAFLNNIDERFRLYERHEWQPYLQHKGLGAAASDEEIVRYLNKPGAVCGMCPSRRVPAACAD